MSAVRDPGSWLASRALAWPTACALSVVALLEARAAVAPGRAVPLSHPAGIVAMAAAVTLALAAAGSSRRRERLALACLALAVALAGAQALASGLIPPAAHALAEAAAFGASAALIGLGARHPGSSRHGGGNAPA